MGKELIATGDQGKFRLGLEYDKSTALHTNNMRSRKVETLLLAQPEVASVFSNVGGASSGIGSMGVGAEHRTELTVQLVSRAERGNESSDAYMMRIRRVLQDSFPSVDITMAAIGLIPRTAPVEIHPQRCGPCGRDAHRTRIEGHPHRHSRCQQRSLEQRDGKSRTAGIPGPR